MLRHTGGKPTELEFVSIDALVPKDHLLRKIERAVDFSFIREKVACLYCADNGRPAIDPVVLFKMLLLGYLYGIRSERKMVQEIQVNVACRWFLGFTFADKVPDSSTLSQNRRRRFRESTLYQEVFDEIVLLAVKKWLVDGKVLYTDSTHLKANANPNKFTKEVDRSPRGAIWTNWTWRSMKTSGARPATAEAGSAWSGAQGDPHQHHRSGERQIFGVIASWRMPHRPGFFTKRDFRYDRLADQYLCPAGQVLAYRTTNRRGIASTSRMAICAHCPLRECCTQSATHVKVLMRHVWERSKERIGYHRQLERGKAIYALRKQTVERSFADAKELHGHRYARRRGLKNVQEQSPMCAICQNIKKIALLTGGSLKNRWLWLWQRFLPASPPALCPVRVHRQPW